MDYGLWTKKNNHLKSNYMKRSFTNATLTLILVMAFCAAASAQSQRTRDKLFPTFQQDLSASQKKDADRDPRATATSTRSLIFTNYQPGASRPAGVQRIAPRVVTAAGGRQSLPSDISATEAAKNADKPARIVKPQVPQQ
jgi:hypothetical protein